MKPLSLAMLLSLPVVASANNVYIGAALGSNQLEDAYTDASDTAFKLFTGFKFLDNLAIEVVYADLGTPKTSVNFFAGKQITKYDASIFGINGVFILPLSQQFEILGKLGLFRWSTDASIETQSLYPGAFSGTISDNGSDISFGAGIHFNATDKITLGVEYDAYNYDIDIGYKNDTVKNSLFSASFKYSF